MTVGTSRIALAVARRTSALSRRAEDRLLPTDRLAWIFGSPRSGTTWLYAMLRTHPLVRGVNEPLIGAHLGVSRGAVAEGIDAPDELLYDTARTSQDYVFADGSGWER